ncbi:MAG: hypothetical protein WC269_01695 [Candidatus Gracilibacteria bacterium]|jgi:hypothetical protein
MGAETPNLPSAPSNAPNPPEGQGEGAIAALQKKYEKSQEWAKLADQIRDTKDEQKLLKIAKILGLKIEQNPDANTTGLKQKTAEYENAQAKNLIIDAFVKVCESGEEGKINQIKSILGEGGLILRVSPETEKFMKDQLALIVTKNGIEGIGGAKAMISKDGKIVGLEFDENTQAVDIKVTDPSSQKWQMTLTNKNNIEVVDFEGNAMIKYETFSKTRG